MYAIYFLSPFFWNNFDFSNGYEFKSFLICANSSQILHTVNVGDSGFVLIRSGKIVYQSPVQQRRFNCPYQLGKTRDNPSIAQVCNIGLLSGLFC